MKNDNIYDEKFITVEEAANVLGLAPKTVYNRKGGTEGLLRVRQGKTVRLLRSEVLEHKQKRIEEAKRKLKMIYGED